MQGINLRELVQKRGTGYKCLVEAVIDHELCPGDPLTDTILKGAQGVGYDFWPWNGEWWNLTIAVEWELGYRCNYTEIYKKRDKIRKPITEIKFIREFRRDEVLPKNNPLMIKK